MMIFEYKFVHAPQQIAGSAGLCAEGTSFAPTLQREINLITCGGWEFVGSEEMPVERRRWLLLRRMVNENFLVFRRAITETDAKPRPKSIAPAGDVERIRPRRVCRNYFPDRLDPPTVRRRASNQVQPN